MKILFASIAIFGYLLNTNNKKVLSYIVWLISNTLWSFYNFYIKEYEMAVMFLIYDIFCIYGIINNNKK